VHVYPQACIAIHHLWLARHISSDVQDGLPGRVRGAHVLHRARRNQPGCAKRPAQVWSQYTTTLLRDAANQPLHLIIQIYDITDRRRVEEALRTSEERLRILVANLLVILFALDADGVFTLSEGQGLDRLGLVPGAAVGHSAFDLYATNALIVDQTRRALAGEAVSLYATSAHLTSPPFAHAV